MAVRKLIKKAEPVKAIQWDGANTLELKGWTGGEFRAFSLQERQDTGYSAQLDSSSEVRFPTLRVGDWVVLDEDGDPYVLTQDEVDIRYIVQ